MYNENWLEKFDQFFGNKTVLSIYLLQLDGETSSQHPTPIAKPIVRYSLCGFKE